MTEETTNMEAEMPNVPEAEAGAEAGIPESINLSDLEHYYRLLIYQHNVVLSEVLNLPK